MLGGWEARKLGSKEAQQVVILLYSPQLITRKTKHLHDYKTNENI